MVAPVHPLLALAPRFHRSAAQHRRTAPTRGAANKAFRVSRKAGGLFRTAVISLGSRATRPRPWLPCADTKMLQMVHRRT